jgi:branched-chain amino acid transport system substrate-binding protein
MLISGTRFFLILLTMAALMALAATRLAAQDIVIGVLHWEKFAYAEMMKNSYNMAVDAINRAGGVKGRTLKLAFANDRGERRGGEDAVADLVKRQGAVMLIGGYSSSNTLYTALAANRYDVPLVVCTAADDRITQRQQENVYRMNPPAGEYAKGLQDFLTHRVAPRSMAIVYENSPYGTGGAMKMMWFCRENDIELMAIIPYFRERAGPDYFERILAPLKSRSPDVIYMVSYLQDAVQLVAKIRGMKLKALLCGGAGGFTHYKFIEKAADSGNRLVTAALWAPETGFRGAEAYYRDYLKKYAKAPDYHGAEAYAAVLVATEALKTAEDFTSQAIRAALDRIDMQTPFGRVRFTSYDDHERQNQIDTLVLQVIDGHFDCIWPETLSTNRFQPPLYWRAH